MTTIRLQGNWEKLLIESLETGFEKSYLAGFGEYVVKIDEIVSLMPNNVKQELKKFAENRDLKHFDFRVPYNYLSEKGLNTICDLRDVYRKFLSDENKERFKSIFKRNNQKQAQDLRNISVYTLYGNKLVFPREKREEIKITNFFNCLLNLRKINLDYWYRKPITELVVSVSEKNVWILEFLKKFLSTYKSPKEFYLDSKDGLYKMNIDPLELERLDRDKLFELFSNTSYGKIISYLQLSSLLTGPLSFIAASVIKKLAGENSYSAREKIYKGILSTALINLLLASTFLDLTDNDNRTIKESFYGEKLEIEATYKIDGKDWKSFTSLEGLSTGLASLLSLYYYKTRPEFDLRKDSSAYVKELEIEVYINGKEYKKEEIAYKGEELEFFIKSENENESQERKALVYTLIIKPENKIYLKDLEDPSKRRKEIIKLFNKAYINLETPNKLSKEFMKEILEVMEKEPNKREIEKILMF